MKIKLLLIGTILALLLSVAVPVAALAAEPKTEFSASVIPTNVVLLEENPLGNSGRVLAKERIDGFVGYSTWDLLENATVEITARTVYASSPTGERKGVMVGTAVFTKWNADYTVAGTLELVYTSKISGFGGLVWDGQWTTVKATGVFKGIKAKGTISANLLAGIPPTLSGWYLEH